MKKFLKEKKNLCLWIGLELIILIVVAVRGFLAQPVQMTYRGETLPFSYGNMELVELNADGSYVISSDNWSSEEEAWRIEHVKLPRGSYTIRVSYEAENTLQGADNTCIWIRCTDARNYFSDECISISNSDNALTKKIRLNQDTEELSISVKYGGMGTLSVKEITIGQDKNGYVADWISLLGIFLLIDFFAFIVFGRENQQISTDKKQRICIMALIVGFASLPMFSDYLNSGHDLYSHICRIDAIADSISEGQFPVRIYSTAYHNFGYICPVFYGEIFLYIPAVLHLLGFPLYRAYQIYVILVNASTCVLAYICFTRMFRNKNAGVFGAMLYTCSAYRIVNIYARAAVGEYTAMTFFPVVVYGLWCLFSTGEDAVKYRKRVWIWFSVAFTGIFQSHMLSTEMVAVFLVIVGILFIKKIFTKEVLLTVIKTGVTTLLLNLWFLLPFLQYMQGNYNINQSEISAIEKNGLYLGQIFNVFFSRRGINVENGMSGEMPLLIGITLSGGVLLFLFCRMKCGVLRDEVWQLGKITAILGAVALWFSSVYCPWDSVKKWNQTLASYLCKVVYPWRYLAIASVLLCVTAVAAVMLLKRVYKYGFQMAAGVMGLLIILTTGSFYSNYLYENEEKEYVDVEALNFRFDDFYLPPEAGSTPEDFWEYVIETDEGMDVTDYEYDRGVRRFYCNNQNAYEASVTIPVIYYPDYVAKDANNGMTFPMQMDEKGQTQITIPAEYSGELRVWFRPQTGWRICEGISFVSLCLLIVCGILGYKKERKRNEART